MKVYFGEFGEQHVPEKMFPALQELEDEFSDAWHDREFRAEFKS